MGFHRGLDEWTIGGELTNLSPENNFQAVVFQYVQGTQALLLPLGSTLYEKGVQTWHEVRNSSPKAARHPTCPELYSSVPASLYARQPYFLGQTCLFRCSSSSTSIIPVLVPPLLLPPLLLLVRFLLLLCAVEGLRILGTTCRLNYQDDN